MLAPARFGLSGPAGALVLLCRVDPAGPKLTSTPEFREAGFQAALAKLAQEHGLFGLVLLELERSGVLSEMPAEVAADYTNSLRLLRRQAALWDLERDFVLSILDAQDIPAVLLKGSALRLTAYQSSAQRPFGDLDVLVPESMLDAAVTALTGGGYQNETADRARLYREHHHHLILRKEMGFVVEVHWALEPVRSPFLLDPKAFLLQARAVATRNGVTVRVPCPEHFVLHLSTQSIEDSFSRLGRIVDLDRVIRGAGPAFDWDQLTADAIAMRVSSVVALSLRLAELLFGTPVPERLAERLELSRTARAHLALLDPIGLVLGRRSLRRAALGRLLLLWSIPDFATRMTVFRGMHSGEQDWFSHFLKAEGNAARRDRSPTVVTLKLGLYQVWVYFSALGARLSGRRRVRLFWSSRLDSSHRGGDP